MTETRIFRDYEAATSTEAQPLLIGITSPAFGGKTFSALRLATGIQKVLGGEIYGIDTEANRMLHYRKDFKFRHVPFPPPHNPASYEAAISHCLNKGAKVIIVDSMTHEHSGDGGVLDMIDDYIEKRVARKNPNEDEWAVRDKNKWTAQIAPKAERKHLNTTIEAIGSKAVLIFCYRADDKTKPVAGGKPVHLGWQAETTSKLPYMLTIRFLLPPASDGHPNLNPDTEFEKMSIKLPKQFRDWFKPGLQLNEELGERLARWSVEGSAIATTTQEPPKKRDPVAGLTALLALGQWPDAETRILAKLERNHRSELDEADGVKLAEAWKQVKHKPATFDSLFPALPEGGAEG